MGNIRSSVLGAWVTLETKGQESPEAPSNWMYNAILMFEITDLRVVIYVYWQQSSLDVF